MQQHEFFDKPEAQTKDDLRVVCVQDFGDDYHKDIGDGDDLYQQARMIRRRYNEVYEYKYAINVLNLYFARLMVKYGGEERFKIMFKAGLVTEYIPPFPRMKTGKKFKDLLNSGIVTSRTSFKKMDYDLLLELMDDYEDQANRVGVDHLVFADRHEEETHVMKKIASEATLKVSASHVKNMTQDAFETYFLQKQVSNRSERDVVDHTTEFTVTDILDPDFDDNVVDISESSDEFMYYNGSFVKKEDIGVLNTINNLGKAGWDNVKMTRRIRGSKNILRIARSDKEKKKRSKKKNRDIGENLMLDFAGASDEHQSFGDYEQAMVDFTAKNLNRK